MSKLYKTCFFFLISGERAKTCFENLKKRYQKKRSALRKVENKSGSSSVVVKKAQKDLEPYAFFFWIDEFNKPRSSKTNIVTPRTSVYRNEKDDISSEDVEMREEEVQEEEEDQDLGQDSLENESRASTDIEFPTKKAKKQHFQGSKKAIAATELEIMKSIHKRMEKGTKN